MKRLPFLFLLLTYAASAQHKIAWPGHKKAVIVLTYDDALPSQLNTAIPQLDAAHLTATFFLTGDINRENISKWRAVSAKGYELANHTLYHPCLTTNETDKQLVPAEKYTVDEMLREIYTMNSFLFAVDGKTNRTYAYPCTETAVGGVNYVESLRKSHLVKYARVGGDVDVIITDFKHLDPLQVPAFGLEDNSTGAQLIAFVKNVKKSGGVGILMFHGIGGDYITTPAVAHRELLKYLQKHKNEIWVATFQQAMDYIAASTKHQTGKCLIK